MESNSVLFDPNGRLKLNDFLDRKGILSDLKKRINWFVKYAHGRSSFAKLQEFARG